MQQQVELLTGASIAEASTGADEMISKREGGPSEKA